MRAGLDTRFRRVRITLVPRPIKPMFADQTGSVINTGPPSLRKPSAKSAFGPTGLLRIPGNAQIDLA